MLISGDYLDLYKRFSVLGTLWFASGSTTFSFAVVGLRGLAVSLRSGGLARGAIEGPILLLIKLV